MKEVKKQPYVALARKYRPQGFEDVLGQPSVSVTLKNALASKRIAHAYLFTGPRGVGKTTMARILAKALNCAKGLGPEPCGECDPCREIALSSSLDVLEMDAASHTGVDNVREVIIDTVALAPNRDRYKVFIVDEAHMLSTAAFNALLKTLEEPPAHVVFVLATTEASKIPATIASRCQRFRFRPIPNELLAQHLGGLAKREDIAIEPAALELLARSSEGSLRDAVSLLDQSHSFGDKKITEQQVREMFGYVPHDMLLGVAKAILGKDAAGLAGWLRKIYEQGVEPAQLLKDLRAALEGVYLEKAGLSGSAGKDWSAAAQGSSAEGIGYLMRRINRTLEELRFGDSPRLILELGLFACIETAGDIPAWVERLERLEARLASGAAPAAPLLRTSSIPVPEAAAAVPASGDHEAWISVVAAMHKEKAALGAILEQTRPVFSDGATWKVLFKRSFDLEQAKRSLSLIEAKLATLAGRSIRLAFEVGAAGSDADDEVVDSAMAPVDAPAPAAAGTWRDVTDSEPSEPQVAAFQKAQQILGGKVKIIKKKA